MNSANPSCRSAFSLVEMLVAAALAAALVTVAVMIYQGILSSDTSRPSQQAVTLGSTYVSFYGGSGTTVATYAAPSYGRAALAELVRTKFIDDLQYASAVFCLGRNVVNNTRPTSIPVSANFRLSNPDPIENDTPEAFRRLLATAIPASASTFIAYRGASTATNASIFILKPSQDATTLAVLSVYDIDLTPTSSPQGTYVSVKRYAGGEAAPTDYYDVFYPPAASGAFAFNPLIVCFERQVRLAKVEGNEIDRFKRAAERPFYFVWWPDPAAHTLGAAPDLPNYPLTYTADDPRFAYANMAARTAFFLVVPMFPAL